MFEDDWCPDSWSHLMYCPGLAFLWQLVRPETNGQPVITQIINNALGPCDKHLCHTHVRLIVATYEMHNYCRNNNRPIRSASAGKKMFARPVLSKAGTHCGARFLHDRDGRRRAGSRARGMGQANPRQSRRKRERPRE